MKHLYNLVNIHFIDVPYFNNIYSLQAYKCLTRIKMYRHLSFNRRTYIKLSNYNFPYVFNMFIVRGTSDDLVQMIIIFQQIKDLSSFSIEKYFFLKKLVMYKYNKIIKIILSTFTIDIDIFQKLFRDSAMYGNLSLLKWLSDTHIGIEIYKDALINSILYKHPKTIKYLLDMHILINVSEYIEHTLSHGTCVNNIKMVEIALDHIDINNRHSKIVYIDAIQTACENSYTDIIHLFIKRNDFGIFEDDNIIQTYYRHFFEPVVNLW